METQNCVKRRKMVARPSTVLVQMASGKTYGDVLGKFYTVAAVLQKCITAIPKSISLVLLVWGLFVTSMKAAVLPKFFLYGEIVYSDTR